MSNKLKTSSDFEYDTIEYYRLRSKELEIDRDNYSDQSDYYQTELAKAHELLGRTIHQLSERWDKVNLNKYWPTDNLHGRRTFNNATGKK